MAEPDRPPVFELHIRPMIRLLDREHMMRWMGLFDLWDLDAVWRQRDEVLTRVRDTGDMPGRRYGGPWPDEWIRLLERWVATGSDSEPGHHLVLGTPDGDYRVQSLGGGRQRLTVAVTAPTDGCRVWFELESVSPGQREYTLYLEPAYPRQEPRPSPLQALEGFVKGDATILVINDQHGRHELALP
jgi:hypothetical protein